MRRVIRGAKIFWGWLDEMSQGEYQGHGRKYADSGMIILFSMEIAGTSRM